MVLVNSPTWPGQKQVRVRHPYLPSKTSLVCTPKNDEKWLDLTRQPWLRGKVLQELNYQALRNSEGLAFEFHQPEGFCGPLKQPWVQTIPTSCTPSGSRWDLKVGKQQKMGTKFQTIIMVITYHVQMIHGPCRYRENNFPWRME